MLWHVLTWIFSGIWGFVVGALTTKILRQRHLELPDLHYLPFSLCLTFVTVLINVAQWLILEYFSNDMCCTHLLLTLPVYLSTAPFCALFLTDARYRLLPNRLLGLGAAMLLPLLSIVAIILHDPEALARVWGLSLAMGLVLAFATHFGLGMGDVKLGALLSAWLGLYDWFAPLVMRLLASFLAGAFALILIISKKLDLDNDIAFGPWLITGAFITWVVYLPSILDGI
ncbi:prepilin peptidase [Mobiluncus curtisii]|uniref:prepilin peptidase n=1 Tax=Mobiluncus curtisii TaxID=2051 RepID=UPI0014707E86|nr:A24 family peptidase [Mobiluncus curtisii]NMX05029.1 prepilin peptidase [Mobiluncus curtisii]